ncbi:MAG: choice-of-anchor Q domain-containing protein, partial [Planctomycetota bacterium]
MISVDTLIDEDNGAGSGAGTSLREAIAGASAGDTISFAPALFASPSPTINLTHGELVVDEALFIEGLPAPFPKLVISGGAASRVFRIDASGEGVVLQELEVREGHTAGSGGGVLIDNGSLTAINVDFEDNVADGDGGGVAALGGPFVGDGVNFEDNEASRGGGLFDIGGANVFFSSFDSNKASQAGGGIYSDGGVTVGDSAFLFNQVLDALDVPTGQGGAIFAGGSSSLDAVTIQQSKAAEGAGVFFEGNGGGYVITESSISGNQASFSGGGLKATLSYGSTLSVASSVVSGNTAADGGGLFVFQGAVSATPTEIVNSTISGNTAEESGGGIYFSSYYYSYAYRGAVLDLHHVTITRNRASVDGNANTQVGGAGGGLFVRDASAAVVNSVVSDNIDEDLPFSGNGNYSPDIDNAHQSAGEVSASYSLIGDTTGFTPPEFLGPGNLFDVDAKLDTVLSNNGGPTLTHALLGDSPAIDAGDPSVFVPPEFDQRGAGFPRVAGGRIDIGALEAQQQTFVVTTAADENGENESELSLREAIAAANASPLPDTITFDPRFDGSESIIRLQHGELKITDALTIVGPQPFPGVPDALSMIIDAQEQSRVFNFSANTGDLEISRLRIEGGKTTGTGDTNGGGGIRFMSDGTLTLNDSRVDGNRTEGQQARGGGIFSATGNVALDNSSLSGNSTAGDLAEGGGIFTYSGAVTLTGSSVSENSTTGENANGGGVSSDTGAVTLTGSTVSGNFTAGLAAAGGGIATDSGTVKLNESTVSGNSTAGLSAEGGGIFTKSGEAQLTGSTGSGNFTTGDFAEGGGIYAYSGSVTLTSSTISGNSTSGTFSEGGGIYAELGSVKLTRSTVTDNRAINDVGGGVALGPAATFTSDSSILAANTAGNGNPDLDLEPAPTQGATNFVDRALPTDLRVVSYNVLWNTIFPTEDTEQAVKFERVVNAIDADIWNLQEIGPDRGDPGDYTDVDAVALMNSIAPLPDGASWYGHQSWDNVIVSKYPLTMLATDTNPEPAATSVAIALVDLPDADYSDDLYLMNTHFRSGEGAFEESVRQQQADALVNWMRDARTGGGFVDIPADTPMVVVGDLNTVGGPQVLDTLLTGDIINQGTYGADSPPDWDGTSLADANPLHNAVGPDDYTFRRGTVDGRIEARIDYIVYTDSVVDTGNQFILNTRAMSPSELAATGLQQFDVLIDDTFSSEDNLRYDHLPVVVDFRPMRISVNHSLIGSASGLTAGELADINAGEGNLVGVNPLLRPLASSGGPTQTHFPLPGSPVIDAGDPSIAFNAAEFDQRGAPYTRVADGRIDIGAVESQIVGSVPQVLVVDTLNDQNNFNYSAGDFSLREAIEAANASTGPDTITFDPAVFTGGIASLIRLNGAELEVTDTLTIDGSTGIDVTVSADALDNDMTQGGFVTDVEASLAADETSLDDNSRVLTFSGSQGDLILNSVTLTGGRSTQQGEGGGVRFESIGELVLTNSAVSGNSTTGDAALGGGIFTENGTVRLVSTQVSGNVTTGEAAFGGGISSISGSVVLESSTVAGNSTLGSGALGGGVFAFGGTLMVNRSSVSGNRTVGSSAEGGGVFASDATVTLNNSTVSGNAAMGLSAGGGGISSFGGHVILSHSTVTDNSSGGIGGGVGFSVSDFGGAPSSELTVNGSIVAGNTDNGTAPDFLAPSSTLLVEHSLVGNNTGTTLTADGLLIGDSVNPIDPLLAPLAANGGPTLTHLPLPSSPAINSGDPSIAFGPAEFDQRGAGFPRVVGGRIDIGAAEEQMPPETPSLLVTTAADVVDAFDQLTSLREAIQYANSLPGGDLVAFDANVFGQAIALDATLGVLLVTDDVTIDATSADVTIDALGSSRIVMVDDSDGATTLNVELVGLTLTGGAAAGPGGAIYTAETLSLTDVSITNSHTTGNAATGGGVHADGELVLLRTTISGNTTNGVSSHGGGVAATDLITTDSTISGNFTNGASSDGGGVFVFQNADVAGTTISGNTATGKGGGLRTGGATTLTSSTIAGNTSQSAAGGGLSNADDPVTITGSILAENIAAAGSPDLHQSGAGTFAVSHSIVGDVAGMTASQLLELRGGVGTMLGDSTAGGAIDPLLGPLSENGGPSETHLPLAGSPAINAGDPSIAFDPAEFDQRGAGFPRVVGGRIDIGAVETDTPGAVTAAVAAELGLTAGEAADVDTGLLVWLDASDPSTIVDQNGVFTWLDQSNNASHATQPNANGVPSVQLDWLDFTPDSDGAGPDLNDRLTIDLTNAPDGPWTGLVVFEVDANNADQGLVNPQPFTAAGFSVTHHFGEIFSYYGNGSNNLRADVPLATPHLAVSAWTGGSDAQDQLLWLNGEQSTFGQGSPVDENQLASQLVIGAANTPLDGRIGAVIIYSGVLDGAARQQLEDYAAVVWGVEVPRGPELPGDYNNDLVVNAADFTVWRDSLGASGMNPFSGADGNG